MRLPSTTARAPGRVTLIGDHTDYNEGLSLPLAIDLATEATFTPTPGSFLVGLHSDQFPDPWEIPLGGTAPAPADAVLAAALVALAHPPSGGSLRVTSTVPVGAGLSSSAAFSVALLMALGVTGDALTLARLCQEAEAAAGSHVGLLDPLAIVGAQAGHALFIDFATLETHQVAIPEQAAFVIVHSGTSRELGTSPYATRRAECDLAANHLGRPLGVCELGDLSALPEAVLRRRARHVITECARVRQVERLLGRGNLAGVGEVMTEGHRSLAEDYRVSTAMVDQVVDHLLGLPGVYGAR
ncbi:MAG TPA: galactokinase family protein, partial [Acidimicrobiales bacterium]|nr:galactokinase family protein [Acidimicrobiales bacterium]